MVHCLWSGELGSGLMDRMLDISRVGVGAFEVGPALGDASSSFL